MFKHAHLSKPMDLRAPGAIDQLLAFHRQQFGTARMEEGAGDGGAGDGGDDAAATAAAKKAADDAAAAKASEGKVEDLPEWAQKIITDARAGESKARTTAKQQAADEARQQLAQEVGKALGLIKDDKQQADPTKLAEQVSAAQAAQRESAAELVVWRNAAELKVDAQAVTDSRAFVRAITDLDPSSKTFEEDVKKAAQAAAENNPKLKAARAAGQSGADHAGGSGESSDSARNAAPGQSRIAAAYANSGS